MNGAKREKQVKSDLDDLIHKIQTQRKLLKKIKNIQPI